MLVGYADGDIGRVRQWQAGLAITQLSHYGEAQPALDGVDTAPFMHPGLNTLTDGLQYLRVGLDHLARNPLVPKAGWLQAIIASAGMARPPLTPPCGQRSRRASARRPACSTPRSPPGRGGTAGCCPTRGWACRTPTC